MNRAVKGGRGCGSIALIVRCFDPPAYIFKTHTDSQHSKGTRIMCEANAYLIKGQEEALVMESVDTVEPENDGIRLVNIFGEQKYLKAKIHALSLVDHKIFLKE
jgi:predicted RNA-binding protein